MGFVLEGHKEAPCYQWFVLEGHKEAPCYQWFVLEGHKEAPCYQWFQVSGTKRVRTAFFWVVTQPAVVISYRRFGTTFRCHLQGLIVEKKAHNPNTEFIQGRVWAVRCLSSVVSANRVDASEEFLTGGFLTLVEQTDRLSRNVGKKLPLLAA